MEIYRVSFIGHREIPRSREVEERLDELIRELIRTKEYVEFYIGRNGDFDILAASTVKRAQKTLGHHNSSLTLVLPYHMKDEEYYADYYDDMLYPVDTKTHPKSAITKRNYWMAENSDALICYVNKKSGGAYSMMKYARETGLSIKTYFANNAKINEIL